MSKLPFKAIAVDMDGTFMTDKQDFDQVKFEQILAQLRQQGAHFIIASGRPIGKIQKDFAPYLDRINIVAENGGLLYRDNQLLARYSLSKETTPKLLQFIEENYPQVEIFVSAVNHSYMKKSTSQEFIDFMTYYYPERILVDDFLGVDDEIIKLTLRMPVELSSQMEAEFNQINPEKVHFTSSGYNTVDVIPSEVNKASGLKYFLDYFKLTSDDLIAFGDDFNDLEMLQLAKYGYVMANGNPELFQYTDYRAPSNNDNGVLQVLEQYLAE